MKRTTIKTLGFYAIQTLKLVVSIILCYFTWGIFPIFGDKGGVGPNDIQEGRC